MRGGSLGASADQTAEPSFSLQNPCCQIKRTQSILRAQIVSFCRPCCRSSRLFLFYVLRGCFLSSLGASWGRFWTSKMTLRTSKTLISPQAFIGFRKIDFLSSKMVLGAFWRSFGLLLGPLGGLSGDLWRLLEVSSATFGGFRSSTNG